MAKSREELMDEMLANYSAMGGDDDAGWSNKPKISAKQFLGVSVPIKVNTSQGSCKCFLSLPPEYAKEDMLIQVLEQLIQSGVPVDCWRPKNTGYQQNNNYGNNQNRYNNNRQGWG